MTLMQIVLLSLPISLMLLAGLGVSACGSDDDSASEAQIAPMIEADAPAADEATPGRSGAS